MVRAFGFEEFGGPEVQTFRDVDMPAPMAGELLIEVRAAGVNPIDWKLRVGYAPDLALPAVMGAEASGVVREVGQDAGKPAGFTEGDEVFGRVAPGSGGYAQFTLLTADASATKPPQVSFTDAATLTVAVSTGYDGVTQLDLRPGQTVLVNGASGGVGVAALQIARDRGIGVVGIAGADKRALVESLGAIFVPYGDGVAERVRELLVDGVDAIFDLAGGDGLRAIAELLADRTKLISAADAKTAAELGGHMMDREPGSRVLGVVAGMVVDGKLDPHVEDVRSLDEAAEAVAAVERGHARGKVVLEIS